MWSHPYTNRERRTRMSLNSHLQELRRKHQTLSEAVEEAQKSPGTDALELSSLKKQKLQLKEQIERLGTA
jgi:hypothetical protein